MPKGRAQSGGAERPFKLPAAVERSDRIWQAERNVIEQARLWMTGGGGFRERQRLADAVRALETALKGENA